MFFHDKAWMKKEIICIVARTFPGFFTIFRAFSQFSGIFSSKRAKTYYTFQQLEHSWRWPRAKESRSGNSCPPAGLFLPRASFNYVLTTTKSLITTDVQSYILMHLRMHLGIYALFEFKWNSSAESDVNSTLRIRTRKWRENSWLISSFEKGIWFWGFQRNKNFTCWSNFLNLSSCYQKSANHKLF